MVVAGVLTASPTPAAVDITDPGSVADRLNVAVSELTGAFLERLPLIVLGVTVLVLGMLFIGLLQRGIVRATSGQRLDASVGRLVQTISRVTLVLVVLLLALSVAGVDVGSALAALGIAGLALAFAVQSILENFISGILILLRRPFRPGDQIRVDGFEGTVEDVNLRVTKLVDFDGELVLLPNSQVFGAPIVNLTHRGRRRTRAIVGVDYRDDHDLARTLLRDALGQVEGVLSQPAPEVFIVELGDSGVHLEMRWWTTPTVGEVFAVRDRVLSTAKRTLSDAGITIPWPMRTLVMDQGNATMPPSPAAVD